MKFARKRNAKIMTLKKALETRFKIEIPFNCDYLTLMNNIIEAIPSPSDAMVRIAHKMHNIYISFDCPKNQQIAFYTYLETEERKLQTDIRRFKEEVQESRNATKTALMAKASPVLHDRSWVSAHIAPIATPLATTVIQPTPQEHETTTTASTTSTAEMDVHGMEDEDEEVDLNHDSESETASINTKLQNVHDEMDVNDDDSNDGANNDSDGDDEMMVQPLAIQEEDSKQATQDEDSNQAIQEEVQENAKRAQKERSNHSPDKLKQIVNEIDQKMAELEQFKQNCIRKELQHAEEAKRAQEEEAKRAQERDAKKEEAKRLRKVAKKQARENALKEAKAEASRLVEEDDMQQVLFFSQ